MTRLRLLLLVVLAVVGVALVELGLGGSRGEHKRGQNLSGMLGKMIGGR